MATLTVVVWLLNVVLLFLLGYLLGQLGFAKTESEANRTPVVVLLLIGIPTILIASAIFYDLSQRLPNLDPFSGGSTDLISFLLIAGFLALGILSVSSLIIRFFLRRRTQTSNPTPSRPPTGPRWLGQLSLFIQWIGLVASILGIISFYLDYLR